MTWETFTSTGSGQLKWRLKIAGSPIEFVSHPSMVRSDTIPERRLGLSTDGFKFAESVELPTAKWKAEPFTVRIVDHGNHATRLFSQKSSVTTYLTAEVNKTQTQINVISTDGFPDSGFIWINTEAIYYRSKTSTTFRDCTRHVLGTGEQAHYTDSVSEVAREVEVMQWPDVFEGRRVEIYAYGSGDDLKGDGGNGGEPVWRGVISTGPKYNGAEWSFAVDSIARFLDQDLAGDLGDPLPIRGIYYPATAPLAIYVAEQKGSGAPGIIENQRGHFKLAFAGFWETQETFLSELNTLLSQMCASPTEGDPFTQLVRAVPMDDGWALEYTTNESDPKHIDASVQSATDFRKRDGYVVDVITDERVNEVEANRTYYIKISGGGVPRTTLGHFTNEDDSEVNWKEYPQRSKVNLHPGFLPQNRLYLGGTATISDKISSVSVSWTTSGPAREHERAGTEDFTAPVTSYSTSDRWINIDLRASIHDSPGRRSEDLVFYAASGESPEIQLGRVYAEGSLADFLTNLIQDTPDYLNLGMVPDLREVDFDLTELQRILSSGAYTSPTFSDRAYTYYEATKLSEIIEQECMLLGVYPCLDRTGKLSFRKLQLPILAGTKSITSREIIVGDQWYSLEDSAIGLYNTVEIKTGYNALEDEHQGRTYKFRNMRAFGKTPTARTLQIAPLSEDRLPPSFSDLEFIANTITTVYGTSYQYLTIEVPFKLFDLVVGEVVNLTWKKAPNTQGKLGVKSALGLVISRAWEPWSGKGTITLYLTPARFSGYVPSAKIINVSGSGTNFTLLLDPDYFAPGKVAADYWKEGDLIRVYRWNDPNAGSINGTIVDASPSAHEVWIDTDSPWDPSSDEWAIGSQVSTSIVSEKQKSFVYVAQSSGRIQYEDEEAPPFLMAP